MNIEACDKGSGKKQTITIENDKGRLNSEEIERLIQEAEKFKDEDNLVKETIDSKNKLESLLYQTKSSIENEEIKAKLDESDITLVQTSVKEIEEWLLENRSKEEYEQKTTEFNSTINPVMMKIYSEGGAMPEGGVPGVVPQEESKEPTIDEVD